MFTQLTKTVTSVLLLFILLYSCSENANLKSKIIGKWVDKSGSVEFFKDGTVIWVGLLQGNYKFVDNNRLKIDLVGPFGSSFMIFEVSIDKEGRLNLKESNGKVMILITEAMAKKEEEAMAYMKSAEAYNKDGQYDKAIEDFNKVIAINSNYGDVYLRRGYAYAMKEQYEKALADLDKVLALVKDKKGLDNYIFLVYNYRAFAYRKKGEYDKALADIDAQIAIKPTDYAPYFSRARIYSLKNNESAACDSLNKAFDNAKDKEKLSKKLKDDTDFNNIQNSNCYKKFTGATEKKEKKKRKS